MKINPSNGVKKAIIIMALALMLTPSAVSAYAVKNSDSVYVAKDETIEGNLYAVGANLTIEGKVTGDVICAGQSINISGEVAGDVICAGQSLNLNGQIGGNLRVVGDTINFGGQTERNGMILGATVVASASSSIGWDLLAVGNIFELRGDIGRDLYGGVAKANLTGRIGKNVNLHFGQSNQKTAPLTIGPNARINGQIKYTSEKDAVIENGAVIGGEVVHNRPKIAAKKPNYLNLAWWWGNIISVFSALVIGLVLISLWRAPIIKIIDLMLNKIGAAFGWGILALLLTPPLAIILLITIIGIPLSLILLALWLIALYVSNVFVGILVGRSLLNNFLPKQKDSLILAMVIGVVLSYLFFSLPIIGLSLSLVAMIWGLGGIMLALKK